MIRTCFDASVSGNPEHALNKEYLITSERGVYASSTICNCNTRKYHGLFVAPQPNIDEDNHVLVSCIDETLISGDNTFDLACHQYPNLFHPDGYKYISEFCASPVPKWAYQAGDVRMEKEIILSHEDQALMIRYTILEAPGNVMLRLNPLLAFRNAHHLTRSNSHWNTRVAKVANGIRLKPYSPYNELFIQCSVNPEFNEKPDWYFNIEYPVENERGYDYHEDLYSPGQLSINLESGDQVILRAGFKRVQPFLLQNRFINALKRRPRVKGLDDSLLLAARQFIVLKPKRMEVKAGFHWFGSWGRDTFISLPGLTLVTGRFRTFSQIMNSWLKDFNKGLFPNMGSGKYAIYNSVDASLWFVWAVQQFAFFTQKESQIWDRYGKVLKQILTYYKSGTYNNIRMDSDGLISAGEAGKALTWMDAVVNGRTITPRSGKCVEVNALWYNAVCFCLDSARLAGDQEFIASWDPTPAVVADSFISAFWSDEKQYLADRIEDDECDWSIRPNQIFAASLPYSPLSSSQKRAVIDIVKKELLTPRGLRTLSENDPAYKDTYYGTQELRDEAYHQGTVWPWLLGAFAEAYLKEYGEDGYQFIEDIYQGFEPALEEKCLLNIAEIYHGCEPHAAAGAVAQAWSVAELLRIRHMLNQIRNTVREDVMMNDMV